MDKDYLQALRYKLQKRIRKLNSASNRDFYQTSLRQLFVFLRGHTVFSGILGELEQLSKTENIEIKIEQYTIKQGYRDKKIHLETEKEYAAMCFIVIQQCVESDNALDPILIGKKCNLQANKEEECLELFNEYFLEPFYEYIDENLDENGAILSLLRKYKERCEWFRRDNLYALWKEETQKGEKNLAYDMYEYLHNQGLDFFIEPNSASGEIDMISTQLGQDRLLLDAKIFNPEKNKGISYIAAGFHQVYTYTQDFNQPIGYLVIFKTCQNDLRFSLSEGMSSIPFMTYNNKTIFFITIDIFPHEKSASQRGKLKSYEITTEDLHQATES